MRNLFWAVAISATTLGSRTADAHPGHGGTDSSGPLHYFLDHPLLAVGLVAISAGASFWMVRRMLLRRR